MVKFLSDDWIDQVKAALAASGTVAATSTGAAPFVLQQRVIGAPGGDVSYWTRIGAGPVTLGAGTAEDATATITSDYELAAALNRGEVSPPQAMMSGRAKVTGDMVGLMRQQRVLAALDGVLKTIPTDY